MTGIDTCFPLVCAKSSLVEQLEKRIDHTIRAKNTIAKAKSVVSPYFGAKDFAMAVA